MIKKNCLHCNKEILTYPSRIKDGRGKFCSKSCTALFSNPGFKKGHEDLVPSSSRKIASEKMKGENNPAWNGGKPKCIDCGNRTANMYAERCRGCLDKFKTGPNSNGWKGGLTPVKLLIRAHSKYTEWRDSVFLRDNYTCRKCGERNGDHNADHIKPFALILLENNIRSVEDALNCTELWDTNNGQTLCVPCHRLTTTYGVGTLRLLLTKK